MIRKIAFVALAAGSAFPGAAFAQEVTAGGQLAARLGFNSNPYLQLNSPGSTGVVGGALTAWLRRRSETSTTQLTGIVDMDQNLRFYGRAENYQAMLAHDQAFSSTLSGSAQVRYQDVINARSYFDTVGSTSGPEAPISTGPSSDLLSIGQRSRSINGDASLNWSPTSRDTFYGGGSFGHTSYPNSLASSFDTYSARGGYLRRVSEKMRVGVDLNAQRVKSKNFPDSTSYQAGLRLMYDFTSIWNFSGHVGLIRQKTNGFGSSSTIGFSAAICGKYPRYGVCVEASRDSASSGFGGLRTDNRIRVSANYDISSRSHLTAGALYDVSDSTGASIIPKQTFWELSGGYSRTLTQRLSGGFSGRYQSRDYGALTGLADGTVSGYSVTLDVAYKFGRLD